jgi:diguanylate cyclase (GGDEF)-like protein
VTGKFLTDVLGQSEHISALIKQSAEELISVSSDIVHELDTSDPTPGVRAAVERTGAVTRKLQDVSGRLTAVNQALQIQIRDRIMVDHQLAAAVEQQEGSRNAALHDNLTGLPNRALFLDRLEHGIAQASRHGWILAVMFVDLDNFKSINDSYGHQAGDTALQVVATRLQHSTRTEDTVSRYGGDEFLYLLTPLHEERYMAMIAAKIRAAIQAPLDLRMHDVDVSPCLEASIGIAVFPKDGVSAAALIKRADEAMYGAKENKSGFAFA